MRLPELQRLLAFIYAVLTMIACIREGSAVTGVAAAAMTIIGYLASRPLPDLLLSAEGWRLLRVPGVVVLGLTIGLIAGYAMLVAIAGGYCAGNRARASGLLFRSP